MSQAAKILVNGFYQDNHTISKWWEKIQTQMSLESNLPNSFSQHEMWVACQSQTGEVVAFCELDNRPPKQKATMTTTESKSLTVRPYMCNLAVHEDWRNQGLAQELIRQCEASVELWLENNKFVLYLKVKKQNEAAIKLYTKLGYHVVASEVDDKTQEVLLLMQREWSKSLLNLESENHLIEEQVSDELSVSKYTFDI